MSFPKLVIAISMDESKTPGKGMFLDDSVECAERAKRELKKKRDSFASNNEDQTIDEVRGLLRAISVLSEKSERRKSDYRQEFYNEQDEAPKVTNRMFT